MKRVFLLLAFLSCFLLLSMSVIPSAHSSMVKEEIKSYDNDYEVTIKGGIGLTITVICDVEDADNLELRVKLYGIPFLTGALIEDYL